MGRLHLNSMWGQRARLTAASCLVSWLEEAKGLSQDADGSLRHSVGCMAKLVLERVLVGRQDDIDHFRRKSE